MDRKTATRIWKDVSHGAPDGVPTGRTLHDFAQRVEALTIAKFEARVRKREGMFALGGWTPKDPGCWCARCDMEHNVMRTQMSLCDKCGDKRCPRAEDHRNECDAAAKAAASAGY